MPRPPKTLETYRKKRDPEIAAEQTSGWKVLRRHGRRREHGEDDEGRHRAMHVSSLPQPGASC